MSTGQLTDDNDYFVAALNDGTTAKIPWSAIAKKIVSDNIVGTDGIDASVNNNVATFGISVDDLTQVNTPGTLDPSTYFIIKTPSAIQKIAWASLYGQILFNSIKAGENIDITQKTTSFPFEIIISSTASGSKWYYSTIQPSSANEGDYWINTASGNNLAVYQYTNSKWTATGIYLKGTDGATPYIDNTSKHWIIGETDTGIVAEGQDGAQGQQGVPGNDGYSVSISVSPITGGHRLTINSTDPEVPTQTIDVMDGIEIIQTTSDNRQVTLLAADWIGEVAPYTQTVACSAMTALVVPEVGVVISDTVATGLEQQKQWGYITRAVSGAGDITFYCYKTKPTIDLIANVKVV